ncbi:MAG: ABC transporter permease [Pirellulales bacterium]
MSSISPQPKLLARAWSGLRGLLGPVVALWVVVVFFTAAEFVQANWNGQTYRNNFFNVENARNVLVQNVTVAVAALGMTVIIIAGGIDLSAGTALGLSATVLAFLLKGSWSPTMAVGLCLATGLACGFVNGVLVSALRVVPFIVTLGSMTFYLGVAKWVANDSTVRPNTANVPGWMPALVDPQAQLPDHGVASGIWLALLLAGVMAILLNYTVFGRHVFALGSNEATARLCGINVPLTKIAVYSLAGLFFGMAGVYQFSRLSSGSPTSGSGMELKIIAAVVIGGGSLSGGRGSILGTLAGAGIMGVIGSGCTMINLSNRVQDMILGVIIVAAVTIDQFRQRRAER